ncbi:Outer membrane protein Imp, required for envelope biogenesis / Organic solvent tolerance protein precursor [hydrothermal vent metagenome]|uniref:Outer membrane protein Imp, required for envelope biogenesis / Organic solvent tolerance protein n=1 Tax=hydrothermal vent metagenome TaxID=652676 RepID=A0A1W1E364_9ZZZZ
MNITADRSEVVDNDYLLTGDASLNSAEYYVSADKIKLNQITHTLNAQGSVKFQGKDIMLTGDSVSIQKQADGASDTVFEQATYYYPQTQMNGQATRIADDGKKQSFDLMSYSLCPLGNTDWQMKADKVIIDSKNNRGVAQNVTLEFMGVPIFYTPHHEWVLEGRSSGLLAPSVGHYTESDASAGSGYQLRIPYYFNIAVDRDFLLTLNRLSTRGNVIKGKYRQLLDKGRVEIEGHYLNKDKITQEARWLLNTQLDLSLNNKTKLTVITNRVSDRTYLKEIAHKNADESSLLSSVTVAYEGEDNGVTGGVFAEKEQLLFGDASYTRAFDAFVNKKVTGLAQGEANFSIVNTQFKHQQVGDTVDGAVIKEGSRRHIQADFNRHIQTNAYSIKPKFTISKTHYAMKDVADQDRSIYNIEIDSKLLFERSTRLFGKDTLQTLTPRLAYHYTPSEDQSALQNFDSERKSASYENLFSGKKFTGLDRISKTNDIVAGLESSFIDKNTGTTYLTLKIAQARHLSDTTMKLDGMIEAQKRYSNIAAGVDLTLDKFTFNQAIQYDPDAKSVVRSNSALRYTLNPRKSLSLTHENDAGKRTVGIYGAYPITQKIHLFAGVNHSLSNKITNRETVGFTYDSCCWAVRVAHFDEYTSAGIHDKVTKFEFVLKGLTSSDSALAARLEKEIPNYLVNLRPLEK